MFAMVFTTRYLDLFTTFVSLYNSVMKMFYFISSYATVYLMYSKFRATYDHNHDSFRLEFLVVPMAGLAVLVNHEFSLLEVITLNIIFCKDAEFYHSVYLPSSLLVVSVLLTCRGYCSGTGSPTAVQA